MKMQTPIKLGRINNNPVNWYFFIFNPVLLPIYILILKYFIPWSIFEKCIL